jgi:hypothetical protein
MAQVYDATPSGLVGADGRALYLISQTAAGNGLPSYDLLLTVSGQRKRTNRGPRTRLV